MKFRLFDYIINCAEEFKVISKYKENDADNMNEWSLIYKHGKCSEDYISVDYVEADRYRVAIGSLANYDIYFMQKGIVVTAPSFECVEATICNIPMSVISTLDGKLLLHCSAIWTNGEVIAFCADKGSGKSTLVYHIVKSVSDAELPISFFTDDALLIKQVGHDTIGYSCGEFMKINTNEIQTVDRIISPVVPGRNYKSYVHMANRHENGFIKKVYFIRQSKSTCFMVRKIENCIEKKAFFFNNIVAIDYISSLQNHLKRLIEKYEEIACYLDMFVVEIPDKKNYNTGAISDFVKEIMS